MTDTPRKLRSQGPAEDIDLDHPSGKGNQGHLNVEEELGFYAAYHSNNINKAIHFACIPMILWSTLIMFAHISLPGSTVHVLRPGLAIQPNVALPFIAGYTAYYYMLEPFAAATFTPIAILMYLTATYLANFTPLSLPLRTATFLGQSGQYTSMPFTVALHVGSWIAQFIGHGVFEGRAPALLTSLTQALVLAPFFVHLEMLFTFFNYRPSLHKAMINAASKRIVAMNRASRAKAA